MQSKISRILIIFLLGSFIIIANDSVLDLIEKGKNAYKEENYELSHDYLQQALNQIQKQLSISFSKFLPEAPAGWSAKEAQTQSVSSASASDNVRYIETSREYIRNSDQKSVEIIIGNSPNISKPYMEMAKVMQNQMMKKAIEERNNLKIKKKKDWYIFHESPDSDEYTITALQEGVIVKIEGADNDKIANKFLQNTNLKGLSKALDH